MAPAFEIAATAILLMTGAGAAVVNELFADVAEVPVELAETTSKFYSVPAVSPVSVTEWVVTSVVFTVVELPYDVLVP